MGGIPQFNFPRAVHPVPWTNNSIFVADSGNNRVVEVDVVAGTLAKVGALGTGSVARCPPHPSSRCSLSHADARARLSLLGG